MSILSSIRSFTSRQTASAETPHNRSFDRRPDEDINVYYDRLTASIFNRSIGTNAVCVDVGCHKGDLAVEMLSRAKSGHVHCFEPLPHLFEEIQDRFKGDARVTTYNLALADHSGETTFNHVISNPGYSGILKRRYDREHEEDTTINVRVERLDDLLVNVPRLDLIKIDVEGAEMLVLRGAEQLIRKFSPVIVFECGLGGSDRYGANGEIVFDFFEQVGLRLFTLQSFLAKTDPLNRQQMKQQFDEGINFYFVAAK
jgi:FkbM family methyltransferase